MFSFPRKTQRHPELTPSWMKTACVSYTPFISGPPTRGRGPQLQGRGILSYEGEAWRGNRLSYHLNVAPIPRTPKSLKEGLILHRCDNQWCIAPKHLYLGSAQRNTLDIFERNTVIRLRMAESARGNQRAKGYKFTDEQKAHSSERMFGNKYAKGYKFTDEQRARQSEISKKRATTKEARAWLAKRMIGNTYAYDAALRRHNGSDKE